MAAFDPQAFFEHAPDMLCVIGGDGFFCAANKAFRDTIGYSLAELRANPARSFSHPDDVAAAAAAYERLHAGAALGVFESRLMRKDGTELWLSWRFSMDAGVVYAAARDLMAIRAARARAQAENDELAAQVEKRNARIAESEARTRLVTDALPALISYVGADFRYRFANVAYERMFGLSNAEIVGKTMADIIGGPAFDAVRPEVARALAGERVEYERVLVYKDGGPRHVHINYEPDRGPAGEIRGFVVLGHDITEQKRQELDRAQLAANERAAIESSRLKSEFLANMSHEIRTPLNGILGMTGLLLDSPLNDAQRPLAAIVETSANNLLSIINDILDFSKIEAGKMSLEPLACELAAIVDGQIALLSAKARDQGIALRTAIDPTLPRAIIADPGRIGQVLLNLVGNALKFTAKGSVTVRVERRTMDAASFMRFSVTDTGIGLSPATIDSLFQPFTQADGSTARKYGGTGLGLSISKRLVDLMGGSIGVYSKPGKGATFWFLLPLSAAPAAAASPQAARAAVTVAPAAGLRALVVEDNAINQMLAVAMLKKMGIEADLAGNGREGVAASLAKTYDFILMDCQMPEMDGYEATRAIRQREAGADRRIPIIALTANAMREDEEKCLASGMDAYLAKPIKRERLAEMIAHVVQDRRVA